MEDKNSQAVKILDKCISELKELSVYKDNSFLTKLKEVEKFLISWNFDDKKIIIFELAGDYFLGRNDFYNSSVYYEKAKALIDIYNKYSISILRKLSMVYFYIRDFADNFQ